VALPEKRAILSSAISAILTAMPSRTPLPSSLIPDERQARAIQHVQGPLLVIAGAGTGKTTVLTQRIVHLIREGHARPGEVLALTYTDNAAHEMRQRAQKELGADDARGLQALTFHAYCFGLLDRCGRKFSVLDDKDLWIHLRRRIRELHLQYFVRAASVSKFLDDLLDFMRRCQDELVGPDQYADYVERLERGELPVPRVTSSKEAVQIQDDEVLGRCREIASVFAMVERMLAEQNLGTFGHMITRAYELLSHDCKLLAEERTRARFILVDEFQDANFAQVKILSLLAGDERNVFAVGDPDQAIYRFRGASSAAFGLFQRQFPAAKLITLERNQRSLSPILQCAFSVINHNPPVFSSGVGTHLAYKRSPLASARELAARDEGRELRGDPVEAVIWQHRELESADLVSAIRQKQKKLRCSWSRFAVIYRNHLHRDEVVEELARWKIPYSIENMDVLDTAEARDLLACAGVVVSPNDSASLFRVLALPQFEIDPEKLRAAIRAAKRNTPLAEMLQQVDGGSLVLACIQDVREQVLARRAKAAEALAIVTKLFQLNVTSAAIGAMRQFAECWQKKPLTAGGELGEFLEYMQLFREARGSVPLPPHEGDAVRLITAHGAKGLEFDDVSIIRAYSSCFPTGYKESLIEFPRELRDPESVAEAEGKILNDQEERRLFYVSMTRARDSLTIYAKRGKGKDHTPAGYVRDLLKDPAVAGWCRARDARPMQVDLFGAEERGELQVSSVSQWLAMDPGVRLTTNLSATAVELYDHCPMQFKLEREWRIPGEIPAAMQYGATMHRVLRTYYDAIQFNRPVTDEALLEFLRIDLAQAGLQDRYQHELYEGQGAAQLADFLATARQKPRPDVLHTEQEFKIRIGNATVAGRMDRIDRIDGNRVVIVDYKTGKPRSQEDADESLQLSLYAIAAHEGLGYQAERLAFHNLEDNSLVSTTRSRLQLEEAKAKVEEVAQKIAAGEFEAKPGFQCTFCAYRNLCPATEKRLFVVVEKKKAASRIH
jgi:superfamily I DNA/RNA helicase/RecB family exonuclease